MAKRETDPLSLATQAGYALESGADFESRTLFLVGEIDEEKLYRFTVNFKVMDSAKGPITVFLSSTGGEEPSGHAFYDLIEASNNPVTIEGYGVVQSIAALILQAGSKRLLSPECRFMIHNGSFDLDKGMNSDTVVAIGKETEVNNRTYHRLLAKRSRLPIEAVREMCMAETYLSADEAVRYGFADAVITKRRKKS